MHELPPLIFSATGGGKQRFMKERTSIKLLQFTNLSSPCLIIYMREFCSHARAVNQGFPHWKEEIRLHQ